MSSLDKNKFHQINSEYVDYRWCFLPKNFLDYLSFWNNSDSFAVLLPEDFYWNDISEVYQNPEYFSDSHCAYSEWYSLESRLEKYWDTFPKLSKYLIPDSFLSYVDMWWWLGYYAYWVMKQLIKDWKLNSKEINKKIIVLDPSKLTDPLIIDSKINRFICTLDNIPLQTSSVSVATSHHVLEHILPRNIWKSISEISRVMCKWWLFYAIIPTIDSPRVLENEVVRDQILLDKTHLILWNRKWWRGQFERFWNFKVREDLEKIFDEKNYWWVFCYEKIG